MGAMFRVHGITDDCTTCEHCGRTNLKRTVRLIELDQDGNDVDAVYYGVSCAARAASFRFGRVTTTKVLNIAAQHDALLKSARSWAQDALETIGKMSLVEYMIANPGLGFRPAESDRRQTQTIAEARQIMERGDLMGTRYERDFLNLPALFIEKPTDPAPARPAARKVAPQTARPAIVSAVQGALF